MSITHADQAALGAGARWALAGGIAAFGLALSVIHLGAEWTSTRDRTFLGRLVLIALLITLAAAGGGLTPLAFVLLVAGAVLGQLLLEAFTFPTEQRRSGAQSRPRNPAADRSARAGTPISARRRSRAGPSGSVVTEGDQPNGDRQAHRPPRAWPHQRGSNVFCLLPFLIHG
jgi:hypothetical protein